MRKQRMEVKSIKFISLVLCSKPPKMPEHAKICTKHFDYFIHDVI